MLPGPHLVSCVTSAWQKKRRGIVKNNTVVRDLYLGRDYEKKHEIYSLIFWLSFVLFALGKYIFIWAYALLNNLDKIV